MDSKGCKQRMISVAYPKHVKRPEDILCFIESNQFTSDWDSLGLDCDNDAISLQLCIMSAPKEFPVIDGTGGLRRHFHSFRDWGINRDDISAYYAYFEDYGIVYFVCLDENAETMIFTIEQLRGFKDIIGRVKDGLRRRKMLR
jgi:hypothetical protein